MVEPFGKAPKNYDRAGMLEFFGSFWLVIIVLIVVVLIILWFIDQA